MVLPVPILENPSPLLNTYSYGGFVFNDNITYFTQQIDFTPSVVNIAAAKIARLEGIKKTGETVNDRQFQILIGIVASSREVLEQKIDILLAAFNQRQQNLVYHTDGRYVLADCIEIAIPVKNVSYAIVTAKFQAVQPFAFASSQSNWSVLTSVNTVGNNFTMTATILDYGTVFNRPLIKLDNAGTTTITNIVVSSGLQTLSIPTVSLSPTWIVDINCDPTNNGYTINIEGSGTLYDFQGSFPMIMPGTNTFTVSFTTSVATSNPLLYLYFYWTSRYLA